MIAPTEEEFKNDPTLYEKWADWYYIHQPKIDKFERELKERFEMKDKHESQDWVKDMHDLALQSKGNNLKYKTIKIDYSVVPPKYAIAYDVNGMPYLQQVLTVVQEDTKVKFSEDSERVLFKVWAEKEFGDLLEIWLTSYPAKFGSFSNPKIESAWQTWLACAKSKFENKGVN